jgi:hypothetical protein
MNDTAIDAPRALSADELDLVSGGKDATTVKIGPLNIRASDTHVHVWVNGVGGVSVNTEQGIICGNLGGLGGCIW